MQKNFWVVVFLTVFLLTSVTVFAKTVNDSFDPNGYSDKKSGSMQINLFMDTGGDEYGTASTGKVYLGPSIANTFAPVRQVFTNKTTQQDRQRYTCPERYIVYAGYFSAGCDYVYMDYAYRGPGPGGTVDRALKFAVFNWNAGGPSNHNWQLSTGGPVTVSPDGFAHDPNIDFTPKDGGWSVVACRTRADADAPWYTDIGYAGSCPATSHTIDTVPGPPNVNGVVTGWCEDATAEESPYIWPTLDVDTTNDGRVITHVGTYEGTYCTNIPGDALDISSLLYTRKIADAGNPASGNWEGPYFIDSGYVISCIVRADKRANQHKVYYAYLRPLYYYYGTPQDPNYCQNGLGHYQIENEVVYRVSNTDGDPGSWSAPIKVTDYASGFEAGRTEPATYDLTGLVDPNGTFHLAWSSSNRNPENPCEIYRAAKMWHWDNSNNCISLAFDASHPAFFKSSSDEGAWNIILAKHNISWCDDKLYITFTRFGAHTTNPGGDTATDFGRNVYMNGDIFVVCSDATGTMGKTWSNAVNLTNTISDSAAPGSCFSEHWPTMAMYSTDSLMIMYIEDKEPGGKGDPNDDPDCVWTDNPVMFMTWPCFTMSAAGSNYCLSTSPTTPVWPEIGLAPNGNTAGCTTPAADTGQVTLTNCGNVGVNYTTSSNQSWLTVISGGSGPVSAGTGPRGSTDLSWTGATGCAAAATVRWRAASATLAAGNYTGAITVDIDNPNFTDIQIQVKLVVACLYYLPEYASLESGCWTVDVFNTPQAGNGSDRDVAGQTGPGNMSFFTCGGDSSYHPLYAEAFIIGWKEGTTVKAYTDNSAESYGKRMRALSHITTSSVGNPAGGTGYWKAEGLWCTPDSAVYGKAEFFVPGHQDTSVLIEKITIWNKKGVALTNFLVGEGIDWDVRRDSNFDAGGIDQGRMMLYQRGSRKDDSVVAGVSPYTGTNAHHGGLIVPNKIYIYDDTGYNPPKVYDTLMALADNTYALRYNDSAQDLDCIHKFWTGTLGATDTLKFIKVKAVSLNGILALRTLIDKGKTFIQKYPTVNPYKVIVSKDTLKFSAPPGGPNPAAQTDSIKEQLNAPMGWTAVKTQSWLTIAPGSGTAPSQLTASIDVTGLAVGTYNDVITITAPGATNSPKSVYVKLSVSSCQGKCGDANQDGSVNVSDAVWIINYVFAGGLPPKPVTACGDANADGSSNVSDAVWIINYVFAGGGPPTDCKPSAWVDKCCHF